MPDALKEHSAKPNMQERQLSPMVAEQQARGERRQAEQGGAYTLFSQSVAASGNQEPPPQQFSSMFGYSEYSHSVNDAQKARVLMAMQQHYGNRYVQRVLAEITSPQKKSQSNYKPSQAAGSNIIHVNQPGDVYEQEADKIAEQAIQRKEGSCDCGRNCSKCGVGQRGLIHRQISNASSDAGSLASDSVLDHIGAGQPLEPDTRADFEGRFGYDFSQVRVHTDNNSNKSAQVLNARAYTVGQDVVFADGQYDPKTTSGQKLLAHEMTHVLQQSQALPSANVHRSETEPGQDLSEQNSKPTNKIILRDVPDARANRSNSVYIQRWAPPEHKQIGDVTGIVIDIGEGFVLSQGEIIALAGDYYASYDDLMADVKTREGRDRIKVLLQDRLGRDISKVGPAGETMSEAQMEEARKQTKSSFEDISLHNFSHFVEGGRAKGEWLKHHAQAISQAVMAGLNGDSRAFELALVREAFGQHFLTDAFSAGHMRVPRQEIVDYYTGIGAGIIDHVLQFAEDRLVKGLLEQLETACPELFRTGADVNLPPEEKRADAVNRMFILAYVRSELRSNVKKTIQDRLRGTREEQAAQFGLYVGGLIGLILHDRDNEQGLDVVSQAQPGGWKAYGDNLLKKDPFSMDQVSQAVASATRDIQKAHQIGLEEGGLTRDVSSLDNVPTRIYFGFNQDQLQPDAQQALQKVARHMAMQPTAYVTLRGHADPIGPEDYNKDLGSRRAHAAAYFLTGSGVESARISAQTVGESELVERNAAQYSRNRRVEIIFHSGPPLEEQRESRDKGLDKAIERSQEIGPPFDAERYIPYLDPNIEQAPLPEWRWGSLDDEMRTAVAEKVKSFLGQYDKKIRDAVDNFPDRTAAIPRCGEVTLRPKEIAKGLVEELTKDPIGLLEKASGRKASGG